jgi:hypothetical protein
MKSGKQRFAEMPGHDFFGSAYRGEIDTRIPFD